MPALLCGSPCVLDHSFPRDVHELQMVADTLGEVERLVSTNQVHLVLTDSLSLLVDEFDWMNRGAQFALLGEVYRLLVTWFLHPHDRLVRVNTSRVGDVPLHPLPQGTNRAGWAELWAEEMGKLLVIHDLKCAPRFCVGVACERAFSTGVLNRWDEDRRAFPLVGPDELNTLEDAYEWEPLPTDLHQHNVSLSNALRNVHLLGAQSVEEPQGDSHYKIHFPNSRPWTVSKNDDPVPDEYVRELVTITHLPLGVIRTALIFNHMPTRNALRLNPNGVE